MTDAESVVALLQYPLIILLQALPLRVSIRTFEAHLCYTGTLENQLLGAFDVYLLALNMFVTYYPSYHYIHYQAVRFYCNTLRIMLYVKNSSLYIYNSLSSFARMCAISPYGLLLLYRCILILWLKRLSQLSLPKKLKRKI